LEDTSKKRNLKPKFDGNVEAYGETRRTVNVARGVSRAKIRNVGWMSGPLCSIYATVYNNGQVVERSLNSIITQFDEFDESFEFVIVDNYSDDGTYEILRKFASEHNNMKLIRARCSRGKGRSIALQNTNGKFLFYVDLDTVYLPVFSKIIKKAMSSYISNSILCGVVDRKTMEKIGTWEDLNYAEDIEFFARAIRKGVKVYRLPVTAALNYIPVKGVDSRESRYGRGLRKYIRYVKTVEDRQRGNGLRSWSQWTASTRFRTFMLKMLFIKLKIQRKRIYSYSENSSNEDLVDFNVNWLKPSEWDIEEDYMIMSWGHKLDEGVRTMFSDMGFDKFEEYERFTLIYTRGTDSKLLEYYRLLAKVRRF
jgi:glycosyltransferase involved in cell wall biosynthesis